MDYTVNQDGIIRMTLLDGQASALLIRSTGVCEAARAVHGLSRTATAALGRLLTATAMLSATIKADSGSITATVKGGGPIGTMIAVGRPNGTVKGWVECPGVELERRGEKLPVGDAVGRTGTLTVVKDLGMREPYVGQVRLVSGEIAEDFAMYFTASEQVPSLVSLGVLVKETVLSAGGLIVQMMPGASEAAVRAVEKCAPAFQNISSTLLECGLEEAKERLLAPLHPVEVGREPVVYRCDCSRERVERALISLGRAELTEMIEEQRGAEVDCQFCNNRRRFSGDDLRALLEKATRA